MVIEKVNRLFLSLREEIKYCKKCGLSGLHKKNIFPVVGRGSIPADILFIGEAPGKSEELFGVPFIGQSGKFFDVMLFDVKHLINREDKKDIKFSFYITNSCLCRPVNLTDRENREPTSLEILSCMNHIINISKIIQPKLVIFLGKIAEKYYKREFRESIMINHPSYLIKGGGRYHPNYLSQIRKLKEFLCQLK